MSVVQEAGSRGEAIYWSMRQEAFSIKDTIPGLCLSSGSINSLETQKPQGFIIMNIPTDAIAEICSAAAYGSQAMIGLWTRMET